MAKNGKVSDISVDVNGVQCRSSLTKDGRFELPDPVPMAPPVGFKRVPDLSEMIRLYVRRELSQTAGANNLETFEEADDFDIEDDPIDPLTPYERVFEAPPVRKSENGVEAPSKAKTDAGGVDRGEAGPSQKQAPPEPSEVQKSTST